MSVTYEHPGLASFLPAYPCAVFLTQSEPQNIGCDPTSSTLYGLLGSVLVFALLQSQHEHPNGKERRNIWEEVGSSLTTKRSRQAEMTFLLYDFAGNLQEESGKRFSCTMRLKELEIWFRY